MDCIYSNIREGEYKAKVAFPDRPQKPLTFASDVDKRRYAAAYGDFQKEIQAYRDSEAEAVALFWVDVLKAYKVRDCEFSVIMRKLAWDEGHGNGLTEVLICFDKLLPLWSLYDKASKIKRVKK